MCESIAASATLSCGGRSIAIAKQRNTVLATGHGMCGDADQQRYNDLMPELKSAMEKLIRGMARDKAAR
jgi:hypothetical protein